MRKLFDGDYTKLNDDVSFQILRTNPKLTTNAKLMYDGEKLYMETYSADDMLSTTTYKHKRVYKSGLFNNDIKNLLNGAGSSAYKIGKKMKDTEIGTDYDNQFENMYWCGCEEVSSNLYAEEFGFIAPIYLRKTLPNYFVIFKVDGPSNISSNQIGSSTEDNSFDFKNDILNKCKILKTFDLREGTAIGDYIRRYLNQLSFDYDKALYVNYSSNEIYYYGIDINTGLMTRKVENFKKQLMFNDNTILHSDDWITNGFSRNGLIFPYIINLEFLFDDNETDDYKFCRYFGMYCNDIDLYEIDDLEDSICPANRNYTYYIKDKYNNLHSLDKYVSYEVRNLDTSTKSYIYKTYYSLITNYPDISKIKTITALSNRFKLKTANAYPYEFYILNDDTILSSSNISERDYVGFNDYTIYKSSGRTYLENACVVMAKKPNGITYGPNATDFNDSCIADEIVDEDAFTGYCTKSTHAYCNYADGLGYSSYMFNIQNSLSHGDSITLNYSDGKSITLTAEGYVQKQIEGIEIPFSYFYDYYNTKTAKLYETRIKNKIASAHGGFINAYIRRSSFIYLRFNLLSSIILNRILSENELNVILNYSDENLYVGLNDDESAMLIYYVKENSIGNITGNRFSCVGTNSEVANTLCECINEKSYLPFVAQHVGSIVTIQSSFSGEKYNDICSIEFSKSIEFNHKIKKYSLNGNNFAGGTDEEGCRFTIECDDITKFIGESGDRYIRTSGDDFENAKITSYNYMIDDYGDIDDDTYIISTDENGKNINISPVKQVELVDKFHAKIGMLSFFPVMDFDFDTIYSPYCDNEEFKNEVKTFAKNITKDDSDEEDRNDKIQVYHDNLLKDRIYGSIGNTLITEYDYFNENILPSLCTISKTSPYISKWGYVDGLDSCENPYRLNCSKIFGVDNFSANLFLINASLMNYTHDMPYIIYDDFSYTSYTNETDDSDSESEDMGFDAETTEVVDINGINSYQYIYYEYSKTTETNDDLSLNESIKNDKPSTYSDCVTYWKDLFENTDKNWFEEVFEVRENYNDILGKNIKNKRAEKKYSRFKFGTVKRNPETLFRGVKFEIVNMVENGDDYKEVYSSKYNDYKFSFIVIPISNPNTLYFNNKTYFIKNDTFKFIVGFIVCNMFDDYNSFSRAYLYGGCLGLISGTNIKGDISGLEINDDTNTYGYEYLDSKGNKNIITLNYYNYISILNHISTGSDINFQSDESDEDEITDEDKSIITNATIDDLKLNLREYRHCLLNMNFSDAFYYEEYEKIIYLSKLEISSSIIRLIVNNLHKNFEYCVIDKLKISTEDFRGNENNPSVYVEYDTGDIQITDNYKYIYIENILKGDKIVRDYEDEAVYVQFDFKISIRPNYDLIGDNGIYIDKSGDICVNNTQINLNDNQINDIKKLIYSDVYNMYNDLALYNIKMNINREIESKVYYNSTDFKIRIIEPTSVNAYDLFEGRINTKNLLSNNRNVINNVEIGIKQNSGNIGIKILNRYSGYYQPIFKKILFFDDIEATVNNEDITYKFTNVEFNTTYSDNQGSFGVINNMFFHKINDDGTQIFTTLSPYYPLTGEYALDYKDYNVFSSNWDSKYYTKQKDISNSEELDYLASIGNGINMFGSKYMNFPNSININSFDGVTEWNDEYLNNDVDLDAEVMYREVNSEKVEFCFFLRDRIIRYFCELQDIQEEFDKWIDEENYKDYGIKGVLDDDIKDYVERNVLKLYEVSNINLYVKKVKSGLNDSNIENDYISYFSYNKDRLLLKGFSKASSISITDTGMNNFDKKITYKLTDGVQEYFGCTFTITKK